MIAFLFPGQGSQSAGMLHALPDHPAIAQTLDEISQYLGRDVRDLDPPAALASTVSVQLALLAAGVATARALRAEGLHPEAVAGLSVGAFAAAVECCVLDLSDAVRLVQHRAELMEAMYPEGYGVAVIIGLSERHVAQLVREHFNQAAPVYVGNINAPGQIVIAGSKAGMESILKAALNQGARKAELLPVSVPSHCQLLEPVATSLRSMLKTMKLHSPTALYVGNVKARTLRNASSIAEDAVDNIAHAVRWFDSTTVLEELGCTMFLEVCPGHVLTDLARESHPELTSLAMERTTIAHALNSSRLHGV